MQNAVQVIISVLLVGGFVLADLVPQLRDKDREPAAVWFAGAAYAFALAVDIIISCGVKLNAEADLIRLLGPLLKLF